MSLSSLFLDQVRVGLPPQAALTLCLAIASVACSNGGTTRGNGYVGDNTFGSAPPEFNLDAASQGSENGDSDAAGMESAQVKLRIFPGVLNLAGARLCHDPDYRADDPYTVENESDPGALPARPILRDELDGGALSLGLAAGYFTLPALLTGAITVHRAELPDGGGDAGLVTASGGDAGRDASVLASDASVVPRDASTTTADASVAPRDASTTTSDASMAPRDASMATGDASPANSDASVDPVVDPCDPGSIEAVLPLPLSAAWLEPPRPAIDAGAAPGPNDAGPADAGGPQDAQPISPERRGFVTTLSGDAPLTLFGSGRALDPKEVALRRLRARDDYLAQHPGDDAGAEAAGRALGAWLESTIGPRFFPSRGLAPGRFTFALSFAHLIPDIPLSAGSRELGSGPLHVCITVDAVESEPPEGGTARHEFRNVSPLGGSFDPDAAYRFRLFVEADFAQANCGVTSLKPVAELIVPKGRFAATHSYTLVAWGAQSATDLCTASPSDSVVRPGCARSADMLNARIEILENELPDPN